MFELMLSILGIIILAILRACIIVLKDWLSDTVYDGEYHLIDNSI